MHEKISLFYPFSFVIRDCQSVYEKSSFRRKVSKINKSIYIWDRSLQIKKVQNFLFQISVSAQNTLLFFFFGHSFLTNRKTESGTAEINFNFVLQEPPMGSRRNTYRMPQSLVVNFTHAFALDPK